MSELTMPWRRGLAGSLAAVMVAGLAAMTGPAQADTSPPVANDPANPATVSATALPTVQINGVAWSQVIIGNTVYVGGEFSKARAAGVPASSSNQTTRSNLLAYDIRTGNLITSWAPSTNGAVSVIKASPDGSRLYIGGNFTTVNGQTQRRIAALNPATGALVTSFRPNPDSRVRAIAVTSSTVYFGGYFGSVSGQSRSRLAAARVSDGALLSWAPKANDAVWALAVSPDAAQVLVAGQFTTLNGSSKPGKGLGSVRASDGSLLPWAANNTLIRNGSVHAAITALATDANSVYATGYSMSDGGGTLEGTVRMSWSGGKVLWVSDCHGDSYGVHSDGQAVYVVSHAHYCGNIPGGFHDTDPWTFKRSMAFSQPATQTLRKEYGRWFNFAGQPAPSILHWFPRLDAGTYTGMNQGAWTVAGNKDYIVEGGEFPRVGSLTSQYGLVRFAKKGVSGNPNNSGPQEPGSAVTPNVRASGPGEALVSWRTNWDRDNANLTYRVIRTKGTSSSTVSTRTVRSADWSRPYQSFLDTGLSAGTYSYKITVTDPDGNAVTSGTVSVAVSGSGTATDSYAKAVLADGPQHYWRMNESSGTTWADYTGRDVATGGSSGVTRGVTGAITGNAAATFSGSSSQSAATGTARISSFATSVEAWFKTTSSNGGKIVGLGTARTGSSGNYDRHIYLDGQGRVNFGARQGTANRVVTGSGKYNDGKWHHAVGVVGDGGMVLYVDGAAVASRADTTTGQYYNGYWRIGGDTLSGWANRPPKDYFTGSVDEVAVYTHVLSASQVAAHYSKAGGAAAGDRLAADEVVDRAADPAATADSAATTLAADAFERTVSTGWGSAPTGGAWALTGGSGNFRVSGGVGTITMASAGSGPRATLGALPAASTDATVTVSLDRLPAGGGGIVSLASRTNADGSDGYRAKVAVAADGQLALSIVRTTAGAETTLGSVALPAAARYAVGDQLQIRLQTEGTSPTTLRAKVWKVGTTEPTAWQLERTDSTSALQSSRGAGVTAYLSGSATNAPVVARFDDLNVTALGG